MSPDQPAFKVRILRVTLNFELGLMNIHSNLQIKSSRIVISDQSILRFKC